MRTINPTQARRNIYQLIDQVAESHEPCIIEGPRNNAVLIGEDDWRAIEETLYLLNIPGMRESIIEGLSSTSKNLVDLEDAKWTDTE